MSSYFSGIVREKPCLIRLFDNIYYFVITHKVIGISKVKDKQKWGKLLLITII